MLMPGAHARAFARHDLAKRRQETFQGVGVFIVDGVHVGAAKDALTINDFFSVHNFLELI